MITDTDRIDRIEEVEPYYTGGSSLEYYLDGEFYDAEGDNLREAIDDAIKRTREYWMNQPVEKRPEKYCGMGDTLHRDAEQG